MQFLKNTNNKTLQPQSMKFLSAVCLVSLLATGGDLWDNSETVLPWIFDGGPGDTRLPHRTSRDSRVREGWPLKDNLVNCGIAKVGVCRGLEGEWGRQWEGE